MRNGTKNQRGKEVFDKFLVELRTTTVECVNIALACMPVSGTHLGTDDAFGLGTKVDHLVRG